MSWLDLIFPKKCLGCGQGGKYFCDQCRKTIKLNNQRQINATSIFAYSGIIEAAIKALKYQFLTDIKAELNEIMAPALTGAELTDFINLKPSVQPVPLYWRRENWRGFNQAKIIAQIVADKFQLSLSDYLIRVKETKPQAELKRRERLKNVKGIFKIKNRPNGPVLVVDDVWSTGATLREAIKVLKKAGVKRVWGLTLAR